MVIDHDDDDRSIIMIVEHNDHDDRSIIMIIEMTMMIDHDDRS